MSGSSIDLIQTAIMGGRISAHEPTGNDALDAVLACVEGTGQRIERERISAAVRVRPTRADHAARALAVPVREVDLRVDPEWWRAMVGPMVVSDGDSWAAVIPRGTGARLVRRDGSISAVTSATAARLGPAAYGLIPTLPDHPVSLRSAVRRSWGRDTGRDVAILLGTAAVSTIVGMIVPLLSGLIIGQFVPMKEAGSIVAVTVILILATVLAALVTTSETLVVSRIAGRLDLRLTEATYERIFRLRTSFHRDHVPGELSDRIRGVSMIQSSITSIITTGIAAGGTLLGSLLVIGALAGPLAVGIVLLALVFLGVGLALLPGLGRDQRAANETSLELGGLTFSMLVGIAKLRTAGAEQRMFDRWAFRFARMQRNARDSANRTMVLGVLSTMPAAVVPLLLVFSEASGLSELGLGEFTAATAASAQAAGAISGLLPLAIGLVMAWPHIQALTPIMTAAPEPRGSAAGDPGRLEGEVALEHVTFGYSEDRPVLSDVTFRVPAGSMTAIVGASGGGKSTIVRLLLGLEEPTSGTVLFDGQALDGLDRTSVLRQMGVVPQEAALIPGSLLQNILASAPGRTLDDAWRAAERAGIADDIRAMPMGMNTVVSDGASTFSGGQRQRLMIARALVHEPAILIFDEATSALDNRTQDIVTTSINEIGATRIVVAHRLSTIRAADQIIVMEAGRVAEHGSYEELMAADGAFRRLASRQIA